MCVQSLRKASRVCATFVFLSSVQTVTSYAGVPSTDLLQPNSEHILALLAAVVLILLASVLLARCKSQRSREWEQRAEERGFAKLIEDSVQAGIERHGN